MFNLFTLGKKNKIWDFDGGIHPPAMKLQSSKIPLRVPPLPEIFIIPLQQHLGMEGGLQIKAGDHVLKGQPLTIGQGPHVPTHAPTSGIVTVIQPHITAHPSGLTALCVHIKPDGEDRWCQNDPLLDYRRLDTGQLLERIHQAGIIGLGGAGFPTAIKLQGASANVDTLIINAAECEPYITADDRLMQEYAEEVIQGINILIHLLNPKQTLIGIEDNKSEAIMAIKEALPGHNSISLRVIPTKYPSGGARQLTKILTGREVPFGQHSATIGVLMQNVGTALAIKRAIIDGQPLIERVVTLTGNALAAPGNVWARLGTPVRHLLDISGFKPQTQQIVIMGGPLMGFTLTDLNVPIVKTSNCILAPTNSEIGIAEPEQPCIRCGLCVEACPAGLLPQQLYWFSQGKEHEKSRNHNLFDCIECGACAWVCPSNIPLVQYYRLEKAEIRAQDQENARSEQAKARFEAKKLRIEQEKLAREQRQITVKSNMQDQNKVQATSSRVFSKQIDGNQTVCVTPGELPDNSKVIAVRTERKQQTEASILTGSISDSLINTVTETEVDPRKAAVAAAIARVKAKKAARTEQPK